jgi:hypothetical protein
MSKQKFGPIDVTNIVAKSNSTAEVLRQTVECKIPVFGPFPRHPVTCYDRHLSLTVRRNSPTEIYLVESPNLRNTQVYRVSRFNPPGDCANNFSSS